MSLQTRRHNILHGYDEFDLIEERRNEIFRFGTNHSICRIVLIFKEIKSVESPHFFENQVNQIVRMMDLVFMGLKESTRPLLVRISEG